MQFWNSHKDKKWKIFNVLVNTAVEFKIDSVRASRLLPSWMHHLLHRLPVVAYLRWNLQLQHFRQLHNGKCLFSSYIREVTFGPERPVTKTVIYFFLKSWHVNNVRKSERIAKFEENSCTWNRWKFLDFWEIEPWPSFKFEGWAICSL